MKYLQFKMEGVDDQGIFTGHAADQCPDHAAGTEGGAGPVR